MGRPYGLLRAGFPFVKTLGMRRLTNFPVDLALGNEGRLYVLCRADPDLAVVRKYTVNDEDLGEFGEEPSYWGDAEGQMSWPVNVICNAEENLFISDEGLHRISSFDPDGKFLGCWGEHGSNQGQLNRPSGIAFDTDENVYVSDTGNHRIQKFTKDGQFILSWGSHGVDEGEFDMPWGITVDELGDVYVADWNNHRIQKFTADGKFLFGLGSLGTGDGEFDGPSDVAVDLDGDIYVADWGNNRVQLFNPEPRYVQKFIGDATLSQSARDYMMTNANPNRQRDMADLEPTKLLRQPTAVVVDNNFTMFVVDNGSNRLQVYQKEAIHLESHQFAPPQRSARLAQE